MKNTDDLISLRKFKTDEEAIFDLLEAGIKKQIHLYVPSTQSSEFVLVTPAQLQRIRNCHPEKVSVMIETSFHSSYNKLTESMSTEKCKLYQPLSFLDLWVQKNQADLLLEKPLPAPMNETEKATLLKLILGMAMGAYRYDPNDLRSTATGNNNGSIKADLEKFGLSIDEGTIRKYLKMAKAMYPEVDYDHKNKILQD